MTESNKETSEDILIEDLTQQLQRGEIGFQAYVDAYPRDAKDKLIRSWERILRASAGKENEPRQR